MASVLRGVTGEGAGNHPVGELNNDVRPGRKKSCLKDGRVVMWKRNGARFEIRQILLCLSIIK